MTPRFKSLISAGNPFLPFYMALVEQTEISMQSDFREQNPKRYLNYVYWILRNAPKYQCPFCSKVFKNDKSLRMHEEKVEDKDKQICTMYGGRYVTLPPFSTLSMDAKTFMCNFGCSIVTEDRHAMVSHLVSCHPPEHLEKWCMNM